MQHTLRTTGASAPGKVILCGEHAVVYGRPAIALPLPDIRATAWVADAPGAGLRLELPDLGEQWEVAAEAHAGEHPLAFLARRTLATLGAAPTGLRITLRSAIPIASGMGSGAALGAALVRALATHLGQALTPAAIAALVYESERFFHGTPSGIDNTVVSYEQPIWFVRGDPGAVPPRAATIEALALGAPLRLVIGDTGVRAPTHLTVGGVRERWQRDPARYEALFAAIGEVSSAARDLLARGAVEQLGRLLDRNQELLEALGVSSPALERLIAAARAAGAYGAKLSGGGGGGIMLALVTEERQAQVCAALAAAGAARVVQTVVA
ncbi:mevalonate kinase [Kallotenue papyrolyticum]|uniref:mevalonate kinase n=1 Tax=Kallotenue papyrolyticum TaxID=1325125 RepID=UPI0005BB5166|nr:mevalonate kinase [Kallotenue papyrolyticum]